MRDTRTWVVNSQERKFSISKGMVKKKKKKKIKMEKKQTCLQCKLEGKVQERLNRRECMKNMMANNAERMRNMMANNANILYSAVRLSALHASIFISKVSTNVPILHMRKLNSKKLCNLNKPRSL